MTTPALRDLVLAVLAPGPTTTAKIAHAIDHPFLFRRIRGVLAALVADGTVVKVAVVRKAGLANRETLWGLK